MIEKMGLKTHVIDNYDNNDCGRPSKKQPTHPRLLCATDTLEPATRALYFAPSVFGIFLQYQNKHQKPKRGRESKINPKKKKKKS
jgi:hypothetical protein